MAASGAAIATVGAQLISVLASLLLMKKSKTGTFYKRKGCYRRSIKFPEVLSQYIPGATVFAIIITTVYVVVYEKKEKRKNI